MGAGHFFNRIKQFGRVTTRFEKHASNYPAKAKWEALARKEGRPIVGNRFTVAAIAVIAFANVAQAEYRGPIIDAHSQFGCEINAGEIRGVIERIGVAHTLIAARGCQSEDPLESQQRVLELVKSLKGRASLLISTKLGGMGRGGLEFAEKGLDALYRADKRYFEKSVGFAEILVQHAPHDTALLRYDGLDLDLKSYRVEKAIELVKDQGVPVVLHLELNDFEARSAKLIRQLNDLATANPDANFVLIHMAQANASEARDLIERHKNIYFLTTTADALAATGTEALRRKGHKAQTGWVNLFNEPPKGAPYQGWLRDYLPQMRWRDDWKMLIEAHPDRFVFAMENVFGPHWTRRYPFSLKIWRRALSQLSGRTARMVACANAKRLWRLNVDCDR